eukprot:1512337-Prymnesium_polylepis.1
MDISCPESKRVASGLKKWSSHECWTVSAASSTTLRRRRRPNRRSCCRCSNSRHGLRRTSATRDKYSDAIDTPSALKSSVATLCGTAAVDRLPAVVVSRARAASTHLVDTRLTRESQGKPICEGEDHEADEHFAAAQPLTRQVPFRQLGDEHGPPAVHASQRTTDHSKYGKEPRVRVRHKKGRLVVMTQHADEGAVVKPPLERVLVHECEHAHHDDRAEERAAREVGRPGGAHLRRRNQTDVSARCGRRYF